MGLSVSGLASVAFSCIVSLSTPPSRLWNHLQSKSMRKKSEKSSENTADAFLVAGASDGWVCHAATAAAWGLDIGTARAVLRTALLAKHVHRVSLTCFTYSVIGQRMPTMQATAK
jgi:hypothetical protein